MVAVVSAIGQTASELMTGGGTESVANVKFAEFAVAPRALVDVTL